LHEWGEYLENASKTEECLMEDCLYAYAKSNNVEKTINILIAMKQKNMPINYLKFHNYITSLQIKGIYSNFTKKAWFDFSNENIHCKN
jgi:K+-transporting ATPase A subunit